MQHIVKDFITLHVLHMFMLIHNPQHDLPAFGHGETAIGLRNHDRQLCQTHTDFIGQFLEVHSTGTIIAEYPKEILVGMLQCIAQQNRA